MQAALYMHESTHVFFRVPPSRPRPGRMGFVRKRPKRPTLRFVAL